MRRRLPSRVNHAVIAALSVLALDRLTKYFISANFSEGQSVMIIPKAFHLTLVLNKGAAFGLFAGQKIIFLGLSIVVTSLIILYIWNNRLNAAASFVELGLILGGAIGNMVDRIAYGYVIDFLDFRVWPVFNIADSFITIGTLILIWKILNQKRCIPS